ncbi:hypothetical protein [Actibacterium sp. 188UL27-1]|uniref:hypothetical protein n=1 Tax=Actibacterium sp. 188UL27-1 TaxID=2786961 RepID=UPI001EF6515D|nr:hypothetical protein [Actibacterium sp. 188UL27-1]
MTRYEYKVMPAPERGKKAKGLRGGEARFAHALEDMMNDLGTHGWEYWRADTLPCEERQGLTGKTTKFMNMLVFRRPAQAEEARAEIAGLLTPPVEETSDAPASAEPETPVAPPVAIPDPTIDAPPVGPAIRPGDELSPNAAAAAAAAAISGDRVRRAMLGRDDDKPEVAAE